MKTEFQIIEHFGLTGKTILEVGCGDGRVSKFLVEKCKTLYAIDPDEKAIAEAKKKCSRRQLFGW